MALLFSLLICGVALAIIARIIYPALAAKIESALVALGIAVTWVLWIAIIHIVLAWLNIVDRPSWM